ncbi:MAG TPA: guanylate kinase [Candidatus Marinimicrobia bacterium]|nr:guanylate kinase [Candidatus Neomarinimicrobiota bacterium]
MSENMIIISSYSGGGKTSIIRNLLKRYPQWHFSVSVTTREKRLNETDGVDYHFVSEAEFEKMIENNELLEYESVHGNYYGTPSSELEKAADGEPIFFDLDVNGALKIAKKFPKAITIFIDVPDLRALKQRLARRKTDSPETINKRLERIELEREKRWHFNYIVINEELEMAIQDVEAIICNEEDE